MEFFCKIDTSITEQEKEKIASINILKKSLNAVILVHNYQRPEIYQVSDFIGDSLELSRKAAGTIADYIIFCGVKFMAETAKLLNPSKHVLLPETEAICSLADMATVDELKKVKEKYPDAAVVSYINTNADIKAMSDICCTSSNAVNVINSLPHKRVIFLPDKNLGKFVQQYTNKELILWDGFCIVHETINAQTLTEFKKENPEVKIIAHPECRPELLEIADYVSGTGGMAKIAKEDPSGSFMVITECGMIHKLKEDIPGKKFYSFCNFCPYMKVTTLDSVLNSLSYQRYEISVPEEIGYKAKESIMRMMQVS